ncbi:MAG: NUDIX hydrolase [Spirosomataceae bacterium]
MEKHGQMLEQYKQQTKCLVALDSIIFGFDGEKIQCLLVKRGIQTEQESWSLMGGWLRPDESLDEAANRIVFELTGLNQVFLEQLYSFGSPYRDPIERTVAVTYYALINVHAYEEEKNKEYEAKWFELTNLPSLLFDHQQFIQTAIQTLRQKAAFYPVGFELLPEKFTLPQLQALYEAIYMTTFDKRNFSRKILSLDILEKLDEKQRGFSKKGAFLYRVKEASKKESANDFHSIVSNVDGLFKQKIVIS